MLDFVGEALDLARPAPRIDGFAAALVSGGDSRLALDGCTGLNKYLCAPSPAPGGVAVSSCTASPTCPRGFARAADAFHAITADASPPRRRASRLAEHRWAIETGLLHAFGAAGLAQVILCPSGTDALLTTALLLAAERQGEPFSVILPSAAETGTGVPLAAACRLFDGPDAGSRLLECEVETIEVPLRRADGEPRPEEEVNQAFAAAASAARHRPIVYLTHGTKTGLIAPVSPPPMSDIIVDACQARIDPVHIAAYLRRGWPVVVTGSKFFGGPPFSGAVLFPSARLRRHNAVPRVANLGTVLRWTAALETIEAFQRRSGDMAALLRDGAVAIGRGIRSNPALVLVGGVQPRGAGWADLPSIFTFAIRSPTEGALLSMAALRPLYERLAHDRVLLGQPVNLGSFGALRIAIGARDLIDAPDALPRVFDALASGITYLL